MSTHHGTATSTDDRATREYTSVRVPRAIEALGCDTFRGFGWTIVSAEPARPIRLLPLMPAIRPNVATLRMSRESHSQHPLTLRSLQDKAEESLALIGRLERSKTFVPATVALVVFLIGCAQLAGSVFALGDDAQLLSAGLGAAGLAHWIGAGVAYLWVRRRRTESVAPKIARELDALEDRSRQARQLLR
ncbi:MAG: hypothetical protein QM572_04420 [Nocardioides sp.]|uniref:hypothetical protein n=1 Tax=Nocardioides sp. TaxID=35761 RepID=UPI0039E4BC0F